MHKPVLLDEVVQIAREISPRWILDGTFGRGGHTRALLDACPGARVVAFDQDVEAVRHAEQAFASEILSGRLSPHHINFHDIAKFKGPEEGFDVILLDLGVSSPQLDQAERGFSFYHDGPLDMRMNRTQDLTAADIVNSWSEVELNGLFSAAGEIRRPQRVVRAIAHDRREAPFTSTRQLAGLIERVEGWRKKGFHPATQYFLALRMAVNNELAGLEACVQDFIRALSPTGRLLIITFHSLEDRIIKYAFKESSQWGYPLFKKVITPSRDEERENPRARSAKLRIFQRGSSDDARTVKRYSPVS
ncbi:MAG: 16S rRNA (cytosine(1402)-N(4))-methyltransferase RsmH [Calothrix sp. SM1_5_4]|nr:16S rRNA (cytosine(1402)-N(4))-methyltransferase RsmH [Calothrix sp. SM1_5_4]